MISGERRRTLVAACLVVSCLPAVAADSTAAYDRQWPQWRGPLASGAAPHGSPPVHWSEDENVRWKVEIPGRGLSTPIVWKDTVFVTTAVPTDRKVPAEVVEKAEADLPDWRRQSGSPPGRVLRFEVLALDRATGNVRWRRTVREQAPHEGTHADGSWASASPVTDGEYLIAHFGSYGTYALDMNGNVKWERDLGDMSTRRGFGEGSSPVLHGETVVINWDHEGPSFITALSRTTGETLWRVERDEITSWSTPLAVAHGGRAQVVVAASGRTRSYDLSNGKLLWEAGGMTTNTIPSPVFSDGRVLVTSGFRGSALQAIDLAKARGDVTDAAAIAWRYDQDTPYVPSPLLYDGRLYFLKENKNILSCLDVASGKPHYTRQRLEALDVVYASPVAAGGRVYVSGRNGTTVVLEAGDELRLLATNELDDVLDASAAIVGDEIYLRGHDRLYCIARSPGKTSEPGNVSGS